MRSAIGDSQVGNLASGCPWAACRLRTPPSPRSSPISFPFPNICCVGWRECRPPCRPSILLHWPIIGTTCVAESLVTACRNILQAKSQLLYSTCGECDVRHTWPMQSRAIAATADAMQRSQHPLGSSWLYWRCCSRRSRIYLDLTASSCRAPSRRLMNSTYPIGLPRAAPAKSCKPP